MVIYKKKYTTFIVSVYVEEKRDREKINCYGFRDTRGDDMDFGEGVRVSPNFLRIHVSCGIMNFTLCSCTASCEFTQRPRSVARGYFVLNQFIVMEISSVVFFFYGIFIRVFKKL